jgi:hypothetical protein
MDHNFDPWVATLMNNHYHVVGFLHRGIDLGSMMKKIPGSVAKLVNDLLPERLLPFWNDTKRKSYMDECLRDEIQYRRAYRYTFLQAQRHRICADAGKYPHTRVWVELEKGLGIAKESQGFLSEIPYRRYEGTRANTHGAKDQTHAD